MKPRIIHLDVICYKEDELWVAHCLQLDLVTTANTSEQAFCDMEDVVRTHIEYIIKNDNWEYLFKPAPPGVLNLFLKSHPVEDESTGHFDFSNLLPQTNIEIQRLYA
ncbi:MAG: hypothetical protein ACRENZ_04075 [Thermodesulfobacteriota bacterium]